MAQTFLARPERVIFGGGKFDSDHRHLRQQAVAPLTTLLSGPSLALGVNASGSFAYSVTWRFKVGACNVAGSNDGFTLYPPPTDVSNVPTGIAF